VRALAIDRLLVIDMELTAGVWSLCALRRLSSECSHSTNMNITLVNVWPSSGWSRRLSTMFFKVSGRVVVRCAMKVSSEIACSEPTKWLLYWVS